MNSNNGNTATSQSNGNTGSSNVIPTINNNLVNNNVPKESVSVSNFKAQPATKTSYSDLVVNKATKLSMNLIAKDGKVIFDKVVKFYVNGVLIGNATTNSKGEAVLDYKFPNDGKYTVKTVFEGDSNYGALSKVESLKVSKESIKVKNSATSIKKGVYTVKNTLSNIGYKKSKFTVYYKVPKC